MALNASEKSLQGYARLTGFMWLCLLVVSLAPTALTSGIDVPGDFAQSAGNAAAAEQLYRISLAVDIISGVTAIVFMWAFYALLRAVHADLALFALLCRFAEVSTGAGMIVSSFTALENYTGATGDFGVGARQALHELIFAGHDGAMYIASITFAVGSTVFFYLLFQSRFVPRFLSGLGMLGSVIGAMFSFAYVLVPAQVPALGIVAWMPMLIAEVGTGLWLLIAGANLKYWNNSRSVDRRADA